MSHELTRRAMEEMEAEVRRLRDEPACRHCGRHIGVRLRRRGLCSVCKKTPAIRAAHPPIPSPHLNRGVEDFCGPAPTPRPCAAPPGTAAKVAELEARAAAGCALFCPWDATWDTAGAGHTPPGPWDKRHSGRVMRPRRRCLTAGCPHHADKRGLCMRCYRRLAAAVRRGRLTWAALEASGRCLRPGVNQYRPAARAAGGRG